MRTISLHSENWLKETLTLLHNGGVIIFPTDTVYGLLADATNEEAIKKLIFFKNRPAGKPISVFVPDLESATEYVELSSTQKTLLTQMLPGPFTVVLPSLHKVSLLLESEFGTLGIRLPDYLYVQQLVKAFGKPLTATSANQAGHSPYYAVADLLKDTSDKKKELLAGIVEGGKLPYQKPSTVVDLTTPKVKVLREGDVTWLHHKTYVTSSEEETQTIARNLLKEVQPLAAKEGKGLAFLLQGELGAGKTVFTKALAEEYGIHNIISPTHVVYYEYEIKNKKDMYKNLYHFDLYNIQEVAELKTLKVENLFDKKNLLIFEWGEKIDEYMEALKDAMKIIYVRIEYQNEAKRQLHIYF